MNADLHTIIAGFARLKLLVVGDSILDCYLYGSSSRLCREAPVPIVEVTHRREAPGGAANVAANCAALGASADLVAAVGEDGDGSRLRTVLEQAGVGLAGLVAQPGMATLAKHRLFSGGQMLVRFDQPAGTAFSTRTVERMGRDLIRMWPSADAIIVSDYGYGVVHEGLIRLLGALQRRFRKPLIVDARKGLARFHCVSPTAVKPNFEEARELLGLDARQDGVSRCELITSHAPAILAATGARLAFVTLDSEGSLLFETGRPPYRTYSRAVQHSRATGAGDTYLSILALALGAGADPTAAAELASAAAAVVLGKEGTAACSSSELHEYLAGEGKFVSNVPRLLERVAEYRRNKRTIVFTNGCFDILHSGHVTYLNHAKSLGDVLIVAVNSDESIKRLKGPGRPINHLHDRVKVLAGLSCVDQIVHFDADTASDLVRELRPEVFAKGGDYRIELLPEAPIVLAQGGRVEILPLVEERSTTGLIEQIRQRQPVPREAEKEKAADSARPRPREWSAAREVLCVRLDTIGDVLMCTPAFRALKEGQPERRLTLLTSSACRQLAGLLPDIDDTIFYDAPWLKASPPRPNSAAEQEFIDRLRGRNFDAAVILTSYSQSPLPAALMCQLADIPLRLAHCHENPYQLLTEWVLDPEPQKLIRHEVERQLALVGTVGCTTAHEQLNITVPELARRRVRQILARFHLLSGVPWIVIHPGATAASRRYPAHLFAEVARRVHAELNLRVIFTGVKAESELIAGIQQQLQPTPSISLAGHLNLADMTALIAAAPLLITNNSGPAHIAAATGTPVVDLYALTNPQHTPWKVAQRVLNHDVSCKYCYKSVCPEGHHHCLTLVEPAQVVAAAAELLRETEREIPRREVAY